LLLSEAASARTAPGPGEALCGTLVAVITDRARCGTSCLATLRSRAPARSAWRDACCCYPPIRVAG